MRHLPGTAFEQVTLELWPRLLFSLPRRVVYDKITMSNVQAIIHDVLAQSWIVR